MSSAARGPGVSRHRRSQWGRKGLWPPKLLENIVILCFERRFSKQNSDICLKSNIFPPKRPPQNFWAGYATTPLSLCPVQHLLGDDKLLIEH